MAGKARRDRRAGADPLGGQDPFAPLAGAKRFERELADARLVAIEGAGHFVFDERRERCVTEVLAFLAGD